MGEPLKVRKEIKIITVKDGVPTIIEFGGHRYGWLPPHHKLPNKIADRRN